MVMHLRSCCCGCSLKTGTVSIAVLSIIQSIVSLILSILRASFASDEVHKEITQFEEKGFVTSADSGEIHTYVENQLDSTTMTIVFICEAILGAIFLILSILMLYGASAERPQLIKPWIVYSVIGVVLSSVLGFVGIIALFIAGLVMFGVLVLVILGLGIALSVYFILVVNSFHTELLSDRIQNKI